MMRNRLWLAVIACSAAAVVSCSDAGVVTPTTNQRADSEGRLLLPPGDNPLVCPAQTAASTTAQVGPLGGNISVGGISVSIPLGALLNTVTMHVTVPASNNVEVDVSVEGVEHFLFELPIVVTVSYAHCPPTGWKPITAWYFDPETDELIEPMFSLDNKLLRSVTFFTDHLSGYILAN